MTMEKAIRRDAFGYAKTSVKKISIAYPDAKLYAMLCLQPAGNPEDGIWMSQLARSTDWRYRESHGNPFVFYEKIRQEFPVFYAKRPKTLSVLIRNISEDGEKKLISYDGNSCCRISNPNPKVLPNQFSLFEEEPENLISTEDDSYSDYNPYDVDRWNEISAYLERQSQPLTEFRWLLPVNYFNCACLRPFLNHLERIPGLHYRFLSHEMIQNPGLLYEIKRYEENLRDLIFPPKAYSSVGRNSSKDRSS